MMIFPALVTIFLCCWEHLFLLNSDISILHSAFFLSVLQLSQGPLSFLPGFKYVMQCDCRHFHPRIPSGNASEQKAGGFFRLPSVEKNILFRHLY